MQGGVSDLEFNGIVGKSEGFKTPRIPLVTQASLSTSAQADSSGSAVTLF